MTKRITYVEIDVPAFTQNSPPDTPPIMTTYRFAMDAMYLPSGTISAIPSLVGVQISPAVLSLGENIGTRTTITAKFRDHRHIFASETFTSGSFWGKFRGRYGLKLRGYPFRLITGELGDALVNMETRNYVIESTNGPSPDGVYEIIAKDVLKFADGDRAQAPVLSNGFLNADITAGATGATLSPAGIGDAEYPHAGSGDSFYTAIGGSEIVLVTSRTGNNLTFTRAQLNTTAAAHTAQDRVQVVTSYVGIDPSTIIRDLLVTYAHVPSSYISLTNWQTEINTYLNTVYTAYIAEPTAVADLISELIEQVGLVLWWDDIGQQIRLQVLRPIPSTADTYDATNYMKGTLKVAEQPEKRLTQVYTYFAKINPLVNADQINNYRSTSFVKDTTAEADYGTSVIKKIFSRWIPNGGRAVADTLGSVLLARFRDPPRKISFDLLRDSNLIDPSLGTGYQIGGYPFQNSSGTAITVPAQITSLKPDPDVFEVETEEISTTSFATGSSPGDHQIIYDATILDRNLRTDHDALYGTPVAGNNVTCTINAGVIVGSSSMLTPALDIGSWPVGVTISVIVIGRIEGHGGTGGAGGAAGKTGGTALKTRQTISINNVSGQIFGGGGGGGGSGLLIIGGSGAGGGGGAGKNPGAGGAGVVGGTAGSAGTTEAGGAGGTSPGAAGAGGGPGLPGAAGTNTPGATSGAGAGGAAGAAIDGISFVTFIGGLSPNGDIRGGQIN